MIQVNWEIEKKNLSSYISFFSIGSTSLLPVAEYTMLKIKYKRKTKEHKIRPTMQYKPYTANNFQLVYMHCSDT